MLVCFLKFTVKLICNIAYQGPIYWKIPPGGGGEISAMPFGGKYEKAKRKRGKYKRKRKKGERKRKKGERKRKKGEIIRKKGEIK
jgi:hypothetical protein